MFVATKASLVVVAVVVDASTDVDASEFVDTPEDIETSGVVDMVMYISVVSLVVVTLVVVALFVVSLDWSVNAPVLVVRAASVEEVLMISNTEDVAVCVTVVSMPLESEVTLGLQGPALTPPSHNTAAQARGRTLVFNMMKTIDYKNQSC